MIQLRIVKAKWIAEHSSSGMQGTGCTALEAAIDLAEHLATRMERLETYITDKATPTEREKT